MSDDETSDKNVTPFRVIDSGKPAPKEADAEESGANDEALSIRITHMEDDHRDLGAAIEALETQPHRDRLAIARLKKKKLHLKDEILKLKNTMTPDIIA